MKLTNKSAQPLMRSQYVYETGNPSYKVLPLFCWHDCALCVVLIEIFIIKDIACNSMLLTFEVFFLFN